MVTHDTLVISREYPVSVAKLYDALTSTDARLTWFKGPDGWVQTERSHEFSVGGGEIMRGSFGEFQTSYTSHYYDIVPNKRFVYSFDVVLGGKIYSASLATIEVESTATGSSVKLTEQLAYIDNTDPVAAHENRYIGTNSHFDNLATFLGVDSSSMATGDTCKEAWAKLQ